MRKFNPCSPCCDPPTGVYFWFITSSSSFTAQQDFADCDIVYGEDDVDWTGNPFSGGMYFVLANGSPQYLNTLWFVGVRSFGWRYERFGDGPVYDWKMSVWTVPAGFGAWDHPDIEYDVFGLGPWTGQGTINDLKLKAVVDDDDNPVLDGFGRQTYTGGIWLENEGYGTECANNVRPRMLLVDARDASKYLPAAEIDPLT